MALPGYRRDPPEREFSRRLLLASTRPEPSDFRQLADRYPQRADWEWVLDRAAAHRVAALLAFRMERLGVGAGLSERVRARLQDIRDQACCRAARAQLTLRQISGALAARGLPFLVIKGSVFAERVYGDPVLRPFHDVDIVVREECLDPAEQAIRSLGYRFVTASPSWLRWAGARIAGPPRAPLPEDVARQYLRRVHQHFIFAPPDEDLLPVELHWQLNRSWRASPADVWEGTASVAVAGAQVSTLASDVMLLHAATHAASQSPADFRLLHLVDVAWVLEAFAGEFEAERVWTLAARWGMQGDLTFALQALEHLLGSGAASALHARHRMGAMRRAIVARAGFQHALIDQARTGGGLLRFGQRILLGAACELARRRLPRYTARAVRLAVADALHKILTRHEDEDSSPERVLQRAAGSDVVALVGGLGSPIAEIPRMTAMPPDGSGRVSFVVHLEDGRRLKGRRVASAAEAERLEALSRALDHLTVPRVISRRGRALMLEWIDGRPLTPDRWTPEVLRRCGALQGALHVTVSPPGLPNRPDRLPPGWEEQLQARLGTLVREGYFSKAAGARAHRMALDHAPGDAERGCAHGNFCADRLVVHPSNRVYLVDTDSIALDALDYDLALTWCLWPMSPGQRQAYLDGYSEHRSPATFSSHMMFWITLAKLEPARAGQPVAF